MTMRLVLPLRRYNQTLQIPLPIDFVRQTGLKEGDQVVLAEDETGIQLKIVRVASAPEPVAAE
jgi:hypothetical protein